jgi:hypothetical protein
MGADRTTMGEATMVVDGGLSVGWEIIKVSSGFSSFSGCENGNVAHPLRLNKIDAIELIRKK